MDDPVKITNMTAIDAREWAIRQAMEIAAKHTTETAARAALTKDIAEALQHQADLMGEIGKLVGGRGVSSQ